MKFIIQLLVLSMIVLLIQSGIGQSHGRETEPNEKHCNSSNTCPTWFMCNVQNYKCQCGKGLNRAIACDDKRMVSAVLNCYCVTYDNKTESTFTGTCYFNCGIQHSKRKHASSVYHILPENPEMLLNTSVCTKFHRTGLLCGDCEDGHSPLVLSYNLSCAKCPDGHKNWWKFILVAFVPLTFFYFFVVLFNINVTSSRLHGVVWFCQVVSAPVMVRVLLLGLSQGHPRLTKVVKVISLFYSCWNLELFRSVIPDICLNVSTLQALALEFVVALYPFLLILISYIQIKLYDRKVSCIVTLWKPFHKILSIFRTSLDIRTSVIDSFATLYLLSYIKILSVTTDLLIPTQIYKLGSNTTASGLYLVPSVRYFGNDHLPYAIPTITIYMIFICIPTLILFLYPFQFFQKCLSFFPLNWHFLHAFIDSFQGCYKDGTEPGTLDCRWFSALYLLLRIVLLIVYATTLSEMYFVYATIILALILILAIYIQPFKQDVVQYPSIDLIFLILLKLGYIVFLGKDVGRIHAGNYILLTSILFVTAIIPLVYIATLFGVWLVVKTKWIRMLVSRLRHND